jgi:nucleoid-associated protein YgaU
MGHRGLLRAAACAIVALTVLVVPVLADELIGRITAVNIDAKKLTVKEKGTDKDIEVIVNDETVVEKGKGKSGKVNLEKMQKAVEKSKDGIPVEITHDKGTASKIVYKNMPKKKADTPKSGETKKDTGK